jgi:F-type H+-transporting ATPase subunit a
MSSTFRGLIIFGILVLVIAVACVWLPFFAFGAAGMIVALPVIEVPGEVLAEGLFFGQALTNTWVGTFIADILVLVFVVLAWNASKGWTNEIPGKFQAWSEVIVEALFNFVKQMAGDGPQVRNVLFPLVATIFVFLLTANWLELLPGVDSVGLMHCADGKQSGYMRIGDRLYNDQVLYPGTTASEEQNHACHELLAGHTHVVAQYDAAVEEHINELSAELSDKESAISAEERATLVHEYEELTGFEHVSYYPSAALLEGGVQPYAFVVTPFVRAAATDLNLTLGLAIVSFFAIQYFGITALGPNYFQKFINLRALGDMGKRPLGAIDFGVGLFEIISEFAKVISLAFRLFGNIFAGQLLLFIMAFLVAMILPVVFYGLEVIVGFIQALVFAVLTLVFSAQAMVSHHHEEDGEHH